MSEENTNQTVDQQAEQTAGGTEQTQEQNQSTETTTENMFTQDDVNNVVAKETKKAQEKLLKKLGIEDFDNAKEGLKQFQEWKQNQMSEAEQKDEQLKTLEKNFNTTTEENASLKAQISAMRSGVHADYVEDVVTLAKNQVSDDVTIDEAIKKVVEKYPHFKGGQTEDEGKPSFSTGKHQSEGPSDAFAKTLLGKG